MKKLQRRFAPMAPAAISETGGRNGTKSLVELSEIPIHGPGLDPRVLNGMNIQLSNSSVGEFTLEQVSRSLNA